MSFTTEIDHVRQIKKQYVQKYFVELKKYWTKILKGYKVKKVHTIANEVAADIVIGGLPSKGKSKREKTVNEKSIRNWANQFIKSGNFKQSEQGKWERYNLLRDNEDIKHLIIIAIDEVIGVEVFGQKRKANGALTRGFRRMKKLNLPKLLCDINCILRDEGILDVIKYRSKKRYENQLNTQNITTSMAATNSEPIPVNPRAEAPKFYQIKEDTLLKWMKDLGYVYGSVKTRGYIDRHEDADVVEYRQKYFLPKFLELEKRMYHWFPIFHETTNKTHYVHVDVYTRWYEAKHGKFPNLPEHGGYLHGDFVDAGGKVGHPDPKMQPIILVLQDEPIYASRQTNKNARQPSSKRARQYAHRFRRRGPCCGCSQRCP